MEIELRDLRWAVAAGQHRSLRQAAETLGIRQSTLSRELRGLETRLETILFDRTNGGTRPTLEGLEFLGSAREILQDAAALTARVKMRARGESGTLRIGVHTSLSTGNLRATLIDHRRRFPAVDMRLVDGSSDHLIADLKGSNVDVAFVAASHGRWSGRSLAVWSERLIVALDETHPLNEKKIVQWADLVGETLILPERGPGPELRCIIANKLGGTDRCKLSQHDVSLDRLMSLVSAGWGVLPALEGATGIVCPGISFRELHEGGTPCRLVFRALWRDENLNPCLRPFLTILRERYPEISADHTLPPAS